MSYTFEGAPLAQALRSTDGGEPGRSNSAADPLHQGDFLGAKGGPTADVAGATRTLTNSGVLNEMTIDHGDHSAAPLVGKGVNPLSGMLAAAAIDHLPDGTYDANQLRTAEKPFVDSGQLAQVDGFLKSVNNITKDGNHITINRNQNSDYNFKGSAPGVNSESLDLDKSISFDISHDNNGNLTFSSIHGVKAGFDSKLGKATENINQISEQTDSHGQTTVDAKMDNPMGGFNQLDLKFKLGRDGTPQLTNGDDIARQLTDGAATSVVAAPITLVSDIVHVF